MRAHPPKIIHMINTKKLNKKEMNVALLSALSATANGKFISGRYDTLKNVEIKNVPFIIDKIEGKSKIIIKSLKNILGKELFNLVLKKKSIRAGRGTMSRPAGRRSVGLRKTMR